MGKSVGLLFIVEFLDGSFTPRFGKQMIREGNEVAGFPPIALGGSKPESPSQAP